MIAKPQDPCPVLSVDNYLSHVWRMLGDVEAECVGCDARWQLDAEDLEHMAILRRAFQ